jgi:DNA repair exonuclease SbcCD ATPase subunit
VNIRRPGRDDGETADDRTRDAIVLAAGTLRSGESRPAEIIKARDGSHPDDRVALFWRVFGGTALSIIALVAVTLYNNTTTNINELRAEVTRVNEARAELVKKEEFNARNQNMWDRMQALQELRVTVTGLKEQMTAFGEKQAEVKAVRDTLMTIEQRLKTAEDDHKVLAKAELTITALEQKTAARDAQLKAAEDDRKEMGRQLQELRERLAKVEGVTETKPMPKSAAGTGKGE